MADYCVSKQEFRVFSFFEIDLPVMIGITFSKTICSSSSSLLPPLEQEKLPDLEQETIVDTRISCHQDLA